jgi:hypothetical protein
MNGRLILWSGLGAAALVVMIAGAKVVGAAGLLDGKRATTHWYYLGELRDEHPAIHHVADRRIVVDQGVAMTTGITASMPMSLTLIEAIAGRDKAQALLPPIGSLQPAKALDEAFEAIAGRYGMRTADFVAMQLEYPRQRAAQ